MAEKQGPKKGPFCDRVAFSDVRRGTVRGEGQWCIQWRETRYVDALMLVGDLCRDF